SGELGGNSLLASLLFVVQALPNAVDRSLVMTGWWNKLWSVVLLQQTSDGGEETLDVELLDILGGSCGGLVASVLGVLCSGTSKSVVKIADLESWDGFIGPGEESSN